MLVVRDVFQAHYGKGDALVALFRELELFAAPPSTFRILVDASGPFFTVVTEISVKDFGEWQRYGEAEMAKPEFAAWFERMTEIVTAGRREFYTLVAGA